MWIISSRRDFSDPDTLSLSGDLFREIDFFNDDSVLSEGSDFKVVSPVIQGKTVLLLVHGYNNEQEEVHDAYEVIEQNITANLGQQYDVIIGYSWPGGNTALDWYSAKRRANAVARRFRFLLQNLSQSAQGVDVMSHSLGARVVLKGLKQATAPNGQLVRNYFCTAAAVDNEIFEPGEEFHDCIRKIGSIFIFHSKKDEVLACSYRVAEFDRALGLSGPEDKEFIQNQANIYVVNCKRKIESHGAYKRSNAMYNYMAAVLNGQLTKFKTL